MQTILDKTHGIGRAPSSFQAVVAPETVSSGSENKLKTREFISWAACFAVLFLITGLIKWMGLETTMGSVTNFLFFVSLAGTAYFIMRALGISRKSLCVATRSMVHNGSGLA